METSSPRLLAGKTALVTGASRGIGRAIALGYAAAGAAVIVNHLDDRSAAEEVVHEITTAGGRAIAAQADISRLSSHAELLDRASAAFGTLHILVNNAGIEQRAPVLEATEQTWDQTIAVNLKGPFFLTQAAARAMIASRVRGRIVNISSTHETRPLAGASIYSISKGGLAMLTKSFALELAPHGITVNALIPGAVRTDINRTVLADPAYEARVVARIPLQRIAAPCDLVHGAVFLASEGAAYMTGAHVTVDGGLSL